MTDLTCDAWDAPRCMVPLLRGSSDHYEGWWFRDNCTAPPEVELTAHVRRRGSEVKKLLDRTVERTTLTIFTCWKHTLLSPEQRAELRHYREVDLGNVVARLYDPANQSGNQAVTA